MFKSNSTTLTTVIGESTVIAGNINSKLSVRIDGRVGGNITAGSAVVISTMGEVHGNIDCSTGNIIIDGTVNGDIIASTVKIGPKGRVNGKIETKTLSIEAGAVLNSNISMEVKEA